MRRQATEPISRNGTVEEVIALAIRGNRLKFHRLGADHTGHERYERALVIIHSASNRLRNRSFLPGRHDALASESRRADPAASRCPSVYAAE